MIISKTLVILGHIRVHETVTTRFGQVKALVMIKGLENELPECKPLYLSTVFTDLITTQNSSLSEDELISRPTR